MIFDKEFLIHINLLSMRFQSNKISKKCFELSLKLFFFKLSYFFFFKFRELRKVNGIV